ncbi:vacuolar protein sorting-associated protein 35 [Leucosporidium creatinivorum]|uniref:Vacuolar protein sorting-associated protein 35 n=1 Tax=Leucosporidium creatinivorum TaxID=106004 RepID=A0A1Y2ENW5_9BASI|nr:vacuolar protein sorting-associated protein 35 [Leucosporidium creatinivorum]
MAEEGKLLAESLATVRTQLGQLKRCLDGDQLMDALKSASTMLAELRSSTFSPKQYYELYMAVFDALRHLSSYLYDAHVSGRHHLADLYELVQYAGNIVPRLYLMMTVGTVYMSIPDAPIKEIMKDMMEMTRGVQHPTRGLFLRHYLSGMTRDHLPVGDDPGPGGNLQDSIGFVLTNFIEMNKLWVRLQHSGLSRDRERREMERRELRILVGTNLVRLSQLEGVDLEMYRRTILPSVLEQVVNCKDVIAQEYLMEVVIQVFTDDFHLRTLGPFLSAVAQLHPKVAIKSIVIALIDRLAAYAAREAENESPEERVRQEEEAARRLVGEVKKQRARERAKQDGVETGAINVDGEETEGWGAVVDVGGKEEPKDDGLIDGQVPTAVPGQEKPVRKFRGIPEDVKLFEVFWGQIVELIKARPDLSIQDITGLLVSLINLSLSCYPDKLEYVDQVLSFAKSKVQEYSDSSDLHHPATIQNLLSLLLAPIHSYLTVLTLLALPAYQDLLAAQPYSTRRAIGHAIVANVLKNETVIETPEDVRGVLELCHVLVRDQKDRSMGPAMGQGRIGQGQMGGGGRGQQTYDVEEMAEEQGWIARMVHLFKADDLEVQFKLLQTARKEFSEGGDRIRWTFPPLIVAAIKLARRYKYREAFVVDWEPKIATLFKFIHQCTSVLYNKVESSEICLRLYLLALSAADEAGLEELGYEFAVQAFTIYEESISESRAQLQAITLIIGTLQTTRVFGPDNYDTLITKAALHGAKLLKKGQQATAVALASHLWWQTDAPGAPETGKKPYRDGKRVLECLQKSLRIATSSIDELTSVQLYCDALDQYLYYFEHGVEAISAKHINSLVELITSNLDSIHSTDVHPSAGSATSGLIEGVNTAEAVIGHFRNTLNYIQARKEGVSHEGANVGAMGGAELGGQGSVGAEEAARLFEDVDVAGPLLKLGNA